MNAALYGICLLLNPRAATVPSTVDPIVAKKAIIKQLQQMDQGDLSPRHFETFYNGI